MPLVLPPVGMPDPVVLSTCNVPAFQQNAMAGNQVGASGVMAANMALFYPVVLADRHTYTTAWWLNGTTTNGNVDVGIYTISGTTATRIVASTAEGQTGASQIQIAATFTTTTIGPGLYYIAISTSSATATFWRGLTNVISMQKGNAFFQKNTGHPLEATPTVITLSTSSMPVFGFAESSAI